MRGELPRASGVYKITCLPTGKIYVGSSVDIRARWSRHYNRLRKGEHHSKYLQLAWNKYGEPAFELTVLECVDPSRLIEAEQRWIDNTRCTDL